MSVGLEQVSSHAFPIDAGVLRAGIAGNHGSNQPVQLGGGSGGEGRSKIEIVHVHSRDSNTPAGRVGPVLVQRRVALRKTGRRTAGGTTFQRILR
jgi:hypothetical protein